MRTKLWIDGEIQLRFVIYIVLLLVSASIIVSIATFTSLWAQLIDSLSAQRDVQGLYATTLKHFILQMTGVTFFLAILACLGAVIISHKVAGPVYRVTSVLKDLQEGKTPTILTLRKGDALSSLMEELKGFAGFHDRLAKASQRAIVLWKQTQVQDLSLNLALKELEDCFQPNHDQKEEDKT